MKSPSKGKAAKAAAQEKARKEKIKLLVAGGLLVALVAVWMPQLAGDDAPQASAASGEENPELLAEAGEEAEGEEAPVEPASENEVLAAADEDTGLVRSPFTNFWKDSEVQESGEEIAPPSVKLLGTMPSPRLPVALVDGRLVFVGDVVQGWELAGIDSRRIVLRSPNNTSIDVEMPLLHAQIEIPAEIDG